MTSYGPFRELQGAIQEVISIGDDQEDPVCFYLIALVGATILTPIWLEYHEVELIGFPAEILKPPNELTGDEFSAEIGSTRGDLLLSSEWRIAPVVQGLPPGHRV